MNNKDKIITKFYELHERPSQIAKELNVVPSYITKIVKLDMERYIQEKKYRNKISKQTRKEYKLNWNNEHKKSNHKESDDFLKKHHIEASKELSYSSEISDMAYVKWNRSAFMYDKNSSDLILNKKLKCGADIPKRVSNIINPKFIKSKKIYV